MVASTGWTWDYCEDTLTVSRLLALNSYYAKHPPTHLLLASYVGFKSSDTVMVKHDEGGNDVREISGMFSTVRADEDPLLKMFPYDPDDYKRWSH